MKSHDRKLSESQIFIPPTVNKTYELLCLFILMAPPLFSQFEIKAGETGLGIYHVDLSPELTLESVSGMQVNPNDPWSSDELDLDLNQDSLIDLGFVSHAAPYSPT